MLNEQQTDTMLTRMAHELSQQLEQYHETDYELVGIKTGGVKVARALQKKLPHNKQLGELNITFYRDDFTRIGLHPSVQATSLPFATDNKHIVLIDDVLMTGRTIRAAMNELFDFGRPASIILVVLADLGFRELPISPNIIGEHLKLSRSQRVKLEGDDRLSLNIYSDPSSLSAE